MKLLNGNINKYQSSKIYHIWSLETDGTYVGSTCQELHKRMHEHRRNCRRADRTSSFKIYQEMNRIGIEHFRIELLERFPCENREELLKREGYWIRNLNATLNTTIAGRSKKQYNSDNQEYTKEHKKRYYEEHKDKFQQIG